MSVVVYVFGSYCFHVVQLTSVLIRTRSLSQTLDFFYENIMSVQSIDTVSSCEIVGSDYEMLKPQSPNLSSKSEVICSFSFKEPVPGTAFIITGVVLKSCERFSINLLTASSKQDVALHFNPRLPQNYIVRNSKISGHWGEEETWSQFSARYDLFRGHRFSIEILITDHEILMGVNGKHFGAFAHRLPFRKINAIEVKGDVKEVAIDQMYRDTYPQVPIENIPSEEPSKDVKFKIVPYIAKISGGFTRNKIIHIYAKVKMLPHSITINLQQTPYFWPHPVIPLHINPRFSNQGGRHIICRNSWANGRWMKEERTDLMAHDLSPGKFFKMSIERRFDDYAIQVNGKLFAEYSFRCDANIVDTINIFGDICLKKIWIEEKTFN
ncbi:CLUMA_CG020820, isoform A [Clunio marinus]|uniref:Galectin n=1 Tax=Clunio marinus TaxID=568069 RepID=A0A1J1J7B0_9DIPT|nr:CLUMA_CG020820, isoform A [Clunio marinus]